MVFVLRRVSDRFSSEASAWLGVREKLSLQLVRSVKSHELNHYFAGFPDPQIAMHRVLPDGLREKLLDAVKKDRRFLSLFLFDPKRSTGDEYILTIDTDRGRVDRELSSPSLLLDPWLKKQYTTYYEYISPTSYFHHRTFFDLLDAPFRPFGGRPFGNLYEQTFLKRQEEIAELHGYSRRFASLVYCLAPQLDSETRVRFRCGMQNLWKHECWMRRRVTFAEAEQALSAAYLHITHAEVQRKDAVGDSEVLLEQCLWTDEDGNVIARREVCCDDWGDQQLHIGIHVFGEYFCHEDAERLQKCFRKKTETGSRGIFKTMP